MKDSSGHNLIALAALVLSAALVVAWVGNLAMGTSSWPVRLGFLGAGLGLTGGLFGMMLYRCKRHCRTVVRHLEALCRLDPREVGSDGGGDEGPPLPADNPLSDVVGRVRAAFLECCHRLQELEHTRASSEIRCRKAVTQAEQIKTILSGLAEPILAIDDYDELVLANRSAEELFRLEAGDAETRVLAQLVNCQRLVNLLTSTCHRKTASDRTDEVEIVGEDGNSRWYRVTATKLASSTDKTGQGEPASEDTVSNGAVAVLRDIGDQKALQRRNAEFVSAVSHEMKTPLAGIKAYVELLVDGDAEDEETQEEFLGVINGQADRLQRLIDNMLDLARIEAGVVNVSKQNHSLNELLEEAVHVVQPSAEAKQIELVAHLSPMYLGVLADRDMLLQSAINLLSNAIKYTPQRGKVTLRSRLADKQVQFEVQDTGVGLSEEDCTRVFEKFYRVAKDKNMASGTGLGLPLAKRIVEDVHRGHLTAKSALGQGSTFTVSMPGAGQLG